MFKMLEAGGFGERWVRLSKELEKLADVKVFGKWQSAGIEANDPGLKRYISTRPILLPHTSGRHEHGRFRKSTINIVERLIDDMMRPGVAGGGKAPATKIIQDAIVIVSIRHNNNRLQELHTL